MVAQVQRKRAVMTAGRRRLLAEDQSTVTRHGTDGHRENGHRGAGAGAGAGAGGVQSGHEQNITLIMIIVILVFMLCNAPARLVQVYCTQIIIILGTLSMRLHTLDLGAKLQIIV